MKEIENVDQHVISTSTSDINDVISMKTIDCMPIEKHECDICYRKFDNATSLKAHKRTHVAEKVFQCTTCLKCFGERSTLKRHMYIHLKDKPFKCDHCERAFSDKSTLRRHTITHTGDKRFECNICKKRFTRNEHLRQHMYIHTSEKLYKCETCEKSFRQRSTLKNHMLLHRTTFKCDRCGASFYKESVYEKHVLWCHSTQAVVKQFKCEFCETFFVDVDSLKTHERAHSGDRPYNCIECNQSFAYKSILKRHMLTHVDKRKIVCFSCSKEFSTKSDLVRHLSADHANLSVNDFLKLSSNQQSNNVPVSNDIKFIIQNIDLLTAMQVSSAANMDGLENVAVLSQPNNAPEAVAAASVTTITESQLTANLVPSLSQTGETMAANTINEPALSFHLATAQLPTEETTSVEDALQPGDNQLLEVQIVRMKNGEQIVHSIHSMLPTDQPTGENPSLVTDISNAPALARPVDENHVTVSDVGVENPTLSTDVGLIPMLMKGNK